MKTKIKFILCVIIMCLFFGGTQDISARFYGSHSETLNNSNCTPDTQPDGTPPPMAEGCILPGSSGCSYVVQARVTAVNTCQYWDSTKPTNSATRFYVNTGSWTNTGFSAPNAIIYSANDTGGSGLGTIMRYTWDDLGLGCFIPMSGNITNGGSITQTTEGDHKLYLCAKDVAGNQSITWSESYKIDKTLPIVSNVHYANPIVASGGWQKTLPIVLTWSGTDNLAGLPLGRSEIKNFDIRVYRSTGAQTTPTLSDLYTTYPWVTPTAAMIAADNFTFTISGQDGYAYKFAISPRDNAGNTGAYMGSTEVARIDTTAPDINQLLGTSSSSQNMLAAAGQGFTWDYDDTGAPVQIQYDFENDYDENGWSSFTTPTPFAYTYNYTHDLKEIDRDRDVVRQGGREYTILVNNLCDQAGNCISGSPLKTIQHYVFADVPSGIVSSTSVGLTDGSAVADGTSKIFELFVKDQFNNQVVPAPSISRSISMNLSNISNTMYLDQYTRTGSGSVYITPPNNTQTGLVLSPTTTQSFINPMTSSDGRYPIGITSYTPTKDGYTSGEPISDPLAAFGFDANLVVSASSLDVGGAFTGNIVPIFKPLYTTAITGNLRDGGFIEGTEQQSAITITNNNPSLLPSPSSPELQLEFNGSNNGFFDLYGGSTTSNASSTLINTMRNVMTTNPTFTSSATTNTDLYTKLLQKPSTTVADFSNLFLTTHFSYTLDSHAIVYNSDIIGKSGFFDTTTFVNVGTQVGIKIIGPIASSLMRALTTNQFTSNASIFSGISRTTVRNNMRQSIALATRNMISTTVSDVITSVSNLDTGAGANGSKIDKGANGSIMKLEKNGGKVTLSLTSLMTGISGKRTLVIKGADLYIDTNMYYNPGDPDSILGVVVQKNDAGQGGNLYIKPTVTNVVGTYIIDGSIMSSMNGNSPMGTSNIGLLKNQLYIYGSIVSENTLGGSRMSPPRCPSLVTTCADAQLYDLNYLRRYYLYQGVPFGGTSTAVVGSGTCNATTCGGFDPNLISKFTLLSDDLAKYPVIIEYNPRIRTNPPIGFEQMTD